MREVLIAVAKRPGATVAGIAELIDATQAQELAQTLMAMGLVRMEAGRLFPCAAPVAA